jgi:RNA polymerase sigma-70 factor (ECF subfamily)
MNPDERSRLDDMLARDGEMRDLARRLARDEHTADDLLQQAWLAGARDTRSRIGDLRAWLRTVIRNLARMHGRSERKRAERERLVARAESDASQPDVEQIERTLDALRASLSELDEPYQSVVRMRYLDGLTSAEIAARLGRGESTVRTQLKRGLEVLRERLDRRSRGDRAAWVAALRRFSSDSDVRASAAGGASAAAGAVIFWRWTAAAAVLLLAGALVRSALLRAPRVELARGADDARSRAPQPTDSTDFAPPTAESRSLASATAPPSSTSVGARAAQSAPLATERATRAVDISVVDALGGPVPNALVVVRQDALTITRRVRADENGRARVELSDADTVCMQDTPHARVVAFADGWSTLHEYFVVCSDESASPVQIELGVSEMRLSGTVVDEAGRPVARAHIEIGAENVSPQTRPDGTVIAPVACESASRDDGSFEVGCVPSGRHRMSVSAAGHLTNERWIDARDASIAQQVRLQRGASVLGRITFADGRPAANARVFAESTDSRLSDPVRADANGAYRLDAIRPGPVRLWALCGADDGRASSATDARASATEIVELSTESDGRWDAKLEPRAGWFLRVVDRAGRPLACCTVNAKAPPPPRPATDERGGLSSFVGWRRTRITNVEGRVALSDGPDRAIDIEVMCPLDRRRVATVALRDVAPSLEERTVTIDPSGNETASVTGSVRDADDHPFPQASMLLVRIGSLTPHGTSVAAGTGEFRLADIPPAKYQLILVVPRSGLYVLGERELGPGDAIDVGRLRAPAFGRLRVRWRWNEGGAGENVSFILVAQYNIPGTNHGEAIKFDEGARPADEDIALLPGRYSLLVYRSAAEIQFRSFQIEASERLEVESGADESFLLPVRIVCTPTVGPAPVRVRVTRLQDESSVVLERSLVASGGAAIDDELRLPEGAYRVVAEQAPDLRCSAEVSLGNDEALHRIVLRLE